MIRILVLCLILHFYVSSALAAAKHLLALWLSSSSILTKKKILPTESSIPLSAAAAEISLIPANPNIEQRQSSLVSEI